MIKSESDFDQVNTEIITAILDQSTDPSVVAAALITYMMQNPLNEQGKHYALGMCTVVRIMHHHRPEVNIDLLGEFATELFTHAGNYVKVRYTQNPKQ